MANETKKNQLIDVNTKLFEWHLIDIYVYQHGRWLTRTNEQTTEGRKKTVAKTKMFDGNEAKNIRAIQTVLRAEETVSPKRLKPFLTVATHTVAPMNKARSEGATFPLTPMTAYVCVCL